MIFLTKKSCRVHQFKKIKKIDEREVLIETKDEVIIIIGNKLHLSYFSKDELLIEGNIMGVNINDVH